MTRIRNAAARICRLDVVSLACIAAMAIGAGLVGLGAVFGATLAWWFF